MEPELTERESNVPSCKVPRLREDHLGGLWTACRRRPRHRSGGPMVWGPCRNRSRSGSDAQTELVPQKSQPLT